MGVGIYFRETRPQFIVLTPVCFLVGLGSAAVALGGVGRIPWGYAILAFLGALFAHVATNVLNDYFDYKSGLDLRTQPTPFSGGSGILPKGMMAPEKALWMGLGSLAITIAIGLYFIKVRGWGLLPIGLLGVLVIVLYSPFITKRPFLCLLAPGLGFGPLIVMGTHYVLVGRYDWIALWASFVPLFLVSNLLLINQFPDLEADRESGRYHVPIMIGRKRSSYLYSAIALSAYLWLVLAWAGGLLPGAALIALIPLPLALVTIKGVLRHAEQMDQLLPFLGKNVLYTLLTPLLLGIGLLVAA